jgi:hypothetical protein
VTDVTDTKKVRMQLERVPADASLAPLPAHHCLLTRVGNEFLLEIGYLDFRELHEHAEEARKAEAAAETPSPKDKEQRLHLYIVGRFQFSKGSLGQLFGAAKENLESLPPEGTEASYPVSLAQEGES